MSAKYDHAGQPTKYKPEYCELLIEHMEKGFSYESFAGLVSVSKQTIYDWEKANPEFLDAKRIGFAKSMLTWEEMGMNGMKGCIEDFSATIWIFNMKNRHNWRDKVETEVTGRGINIIVADKRHLEV